MLVLPPTLNKKPYRILFEHRPHYLYVRVKCETTSYAIAKQYWNEIVSMQHRRKYHYVLIDKEIDQPLAIQDVVLLVPEIIHAGVHDVKFAILDRNYDAERCGFEEMVGTNRGLRVKIAETMPEAEGWLAADWAATQFRDPPPFRAAAA